MFVGADNVGNPHSVTIWFNNDAIFTAPILGYADREQFSFPATLSVGDRLFFDVESGASGTCTYCYLSTGFEVTITPASQ
jgi:hypothetical protein